ncbi:hypothetical protein [Mariprofundus sp. KV]|uniref:hypothetical protein n=1 Tax=Mariprofundus sp. KV TaxID=2608715 RepID=UPI0015A1F627|nr:hypothetical protein [Mariprofundus sp. KV]NWF36178.1 hypothetical protein [Mariprofundus sp. KV]
MVRNIPIVVGVIGDIAPSVLGDALEKIEKTCAYSSIYLLISDADKKALALPDQIHVASVDVLFQNQEEAIKGELISAYILRHAHVLLTGSNPVDSEKLQNRMLNSELGHLYTGASVEDSLIPEVPVLQEKNSLILWNLEEVAEFDWAREWEAASKPDSDTGSDEDGFYKNAIRSLRAINDFNEKSQLEMTSKVWSDGRKWFLFAQNEIKEKNDDNVEVLLTSRPALESSEQEGVELLADIYASANTLANSTQEHSFRNFTILSVIAAIAMVCFVYFDRVEDASWHWNLGFVLFAMFAWLLSWFFGRKKHHLLHLQYRSLAEGIRIQAAWFMVGLQSSVIDYYPAKQKQELGWIIEAMRGIHAILPYNRQKTPFSKSRIDFIRHGWLLDQKKYLEGKIQGSETSYKQQFKSYKNMVFWSQFLGKWPLRVGVGLATYLGLTKMEVDHPPEFIQQLKDMLLQFMPLETWQLACVPDWLLGLFIVIPIAVSLVVSRYASAIQIEAEADWYESSLGFYSRANMQLENYSGDLAGDREMASAVSLRLGRAILHEQAAWVDMHKQMDLFESVESKD